MHKLAFVGSFLLLLLAERLHAQGISAFTYQGRLETTNGSAHGLYDFRCRLYNASGPPDAPVSSAVTLVSVAVRNGLFVLNLDFGVSVFDGQERWLAMEVRATGDSTFAALAPRQRLTAAPYSIYAAKAGDLQSGASPTFTGTVTFSPAAGPPFAVGSNTKIPNLNADFLDGLDSSAFVLKSGDIMSGNLGIANPASINFGTTTRQMLNLWDAQYGLGVQANTLYARSHNHFAWFKDGVHANGQFDPGGGTLLMSLDSAARLTATNPASSAILNDYIVVGLNVFPIVVNATASGDGSTGLRGRVGGVNSVGVLGEAVAPSGIGVYGLTGGGGSRRPAGVYGESTISAGNGVVGVADNGPSAYGVWGMSADGYGGFFSGGNYAGQFNGAVRINFSSPFNKPQLAVNEPSSSGFARLRLQTGPQAFWDMAVGSHPALLQTNSLRFFCEGSGDVMSLATNGNLFVRAVTITGGADISEPFKMSQRDMPRGAVVIIDEANPGHLTLSKEPYDTRVAGIISGAGGVNPGLSLSQEGVVEGDQQVALTGRVYVQASDANGSIKPGDLLTTAAIPGHAMKVTDHQRAHGAILGKAMTSLKGGKGLVLVLVSLQ